MWSSLVVALADVGAVLAIVSGLSKLRNPDAFRGAVSALLGGRRVARPVARLVGLAELALGGAVLIVGGPAALAAEAGAYGVFAVVAQLLRNSTAPSCGCFGRREAPVGVAHVVINSIIAAASVAAAIDGASAVRERLPLDAAAVAYCLFLGLGAALVVTTFTAAAELEGARRLLRPRPSAASR